MSDKDKEFEKQMKLEFLKALHDKKTKTQGERSSYVMSKFAFITGLFGLGALRVGDINFNMLLYFIPVVAIGYDLHIRAADLSIKKMGAFLRSDPQAGTTETEKAWERYSAEHRDKLAHWANTLFSYVIILAAAVSIYVLQGDGKSRIFYIWFIVWLFISIISHSMLWNSHRKEILKLDKGG